MRVLKKILLAIANSRYLALASGIILMVTAGIEIVRSYGEGVRTHHGVALYGLITVIRSIPEVFFASHDLVGAEAEGSKTPRKNGKIVK